MTTALRAQLLSLRTLPSTVVVAACAVAVVAALNAVDLNGVIRAGALSSPELRAIVLGTTGSVCATILMLFAGVKTSGEYRHGTLGLRMLAAPRRLSLLATMLTSHGIVAALTAVAALLATLAVSTSLLSGTGTTLGVTAPVVLAVMLGVTLFGVLGAAVGVICRSQAAAMSLLVGWFAAEKILGGFLGDASAYLPFALLNPLFGAPGGPVAPATAAVALTAVTATIVLVAAVLFRRRDVS